MYNLRGGRKLVPFKATELNEITNKVTVDRVGKTLKG